MRKLGMILLGLVLAGCGSDNGSSGNGIAFCGQFAAAACSRFEACQLLGTADIPATVSECNSYLEGQMDCTNTFKDTQCQEDKFQPCTSGFFDSVECSELSSGNLPSLPAECQGICLKS